MNVSEAKAELDSLLEERVMILAAIDRLSTEVDGLDVAATADAIKLLDEKKNRISSRLRVLSTLDRKIATARQTLDEARRAERENQIACLRERERAAIQDIVEATDSLKHALNELSTTEHELLKMGICPRRCIPQALYDGVRLGWRHWRTWHPGLVGLCDDRRISDQERAAILRSYRRILFNADQALKHYNADVYKSYQNARRRARKWMNLHREAIPSP